MLRMIFIVLSGLMVIGTFWGTIYEGIARRSVPWSYAAVSAFCTGLFVASLLIFH